MTNVLILNKSAIKAREWLRDIQNLARWPRRDNARGLAFLRATLHELRDNLTLNDLAHFSAQLPLLIRGLLFEGWNPNIHTPKERKREDFLYGIYNNLPNVYKKDTDITSTVQAVIDVLASKIDPQESLKLKKVLPHGIKDFLRNVENPTYV